MSFQQLFGLSLISGVGFFVAIIAIHLPIMILWQWYKEGRKSIRTTVLDVLDKNIIHEWIGSLGVIFWGSVILYLSIALFGACLLWLLQLVGLI